MNDVSPEIIKSLLKYAIKHGLKDPYYNIEPGSQKGDNFMGIIYKFKIEDRDTTKVLNIIIKTAASDPNTRLVLGTRRMYEREVWTYRNLMPILKKMKKNHDTILEFTECIEASDEENCEWLAFEDMGAQGYMLHRPRLEPLDKNHINIALTALAELHVLSLALKKINPDTFYKLSQKITDNVFPQEGGDDKFKSYLNQAVNKVFQVIKTEYKEKLQNICDNIYERVVEVLKPNKYAVFCHGDFWKNNIMFKYKDDVPVAVCPLDYQILRASSPATDILYLIVCSTTKEDRKTKYLEYLRHYYTEFCKQVKLHELEQNLFTWPEFLDEIRRCSVFGLGMAMMVLPFMTCSSEGVPEAEDVVSGNSEVDDPESLILFTERIEGVIEDFINYEYI